MLVRSDGRGGRHGNLMSFYSALARPALFTLDPETAHNLALSVLRHGAVVRLLPAHDQPADARLRQQVFGLDFENPVGLAAGLDKQGVAVGAWEAMGFGAAEIGTVTPRPQPGNPRPRLFRLPADEALINRFGFNSAGAAAVARNLAAGARTARMRVGVNIGKNRDTPNDQALDDYLAVLEALHREADYIVINVSSPNTSGLRDLQQSRQLGALVAGVVARARTIDPGRAIPVLVKLSPDLADAELLEAAEAALSNGASALMATNTTTARDRLSSPASLTHEAGGMSGAPLRARANEVCRSLFRHLRGRVPIVGVGGIDSAAAAYERIRAGATLVQIYTALIYHGPALPHRLVAGLARLLERDGLANIQEAIGIDAR